MKRQSNKSNNRKKSENSKCKENSNGTKGNYDKSNHLYKRREYSEIPRYSPQEYAATRLPLDVEDDPRYA